MEEYKDTPTTYYPLEVISSHTHCRCRCHPIVFSIVMMHHFLFLFLELLDSSRLLNEGIFAWGPSIFYLPKGWPYKCFEYIVSLFWGTDFGGERLHWWLILCRWLMATFYTCCHSISLNLPKEHHLLIELDISFVIKVCRQRNVGEVKDGVSKLYIFFILALTFWNFICWLGSTRLLLNLLKNSFITKFLVVSQWSKDECNGFSPGPGVMLAHTMTPLSISIW